MDWSIDTGVLGSVGCDAKELRGVLEKAADHFEATAPQAAWNEVVNALSLEVRMGNPQALAAALPFAEAAKAKSIAKMPVLRDQMAAGISAACALAEHMGGRVTATVAGHHYPAHTSGVFKRMQVFVDRAAPTEDD
jgi:hypothetical protein